MPAISVIVPVYKVEKFISKCIESILNQTFRDFELILVDDGSPDNSGVICDEYAKKDSRIKVIHKKNGGLADARNVGLEASTGSFIGFVDSDDYIAEDMYEKLYTSCIMKNAEISVCGRYNVYENHATETFSLNQNQVWNSKEAISNLLVWNYIDSSACDKLFRRDLFSTLRFPIGKYNEDVFIMVKLFDRAERIVHIGESKYYYFHRNDSITTELFSEKKLDLLDASGEVYRFVIDKYPDLSKRALSYKLLGIINVLIMIEESDSRQDLAQLKYELSSQLRSNAVFTLTNKFYSYNIKLKALLLMIDKYYFAKKLKVKINKN